ncbi:hypothetical protein ACI6PS_13860 [Flavobacterium sp. PLA-1-15]|uniref:hypothetical protein n=1 Tax=Flavobacterium sp. PLA-1-15 TaxID=3380533 RepID=UPI003B764DD1
MFSTCHQIALLTGFQNLLGIKIANPIPNHNLLPKSTLSSRAQSRDHKPNSIPFSKLQFTTTALQSTIYNLKSSILMGHWVVMWVKYTQNYLSIMHKTLDFIAIIPMAQLLPFGIEKKQLYHT